MFESRRPSVLPPPQLTVLGVYSPRMAETSYEQFIQVYAEGRDPANYDPYTIAMFRRFGREAELKPFTEAERNEIEDEVRVLLAEAVYVEMLARIVFTIHFWKSGMPLTSSYGELTCPQPQPLPERLWRLVPYELPN